MVSNANHLYRSALLEQLSGQTCFTFLPNRAILSLSPNGVLLRAGAGAEEWIEADSVVLGTGMRPRAALADSFAELIYDVRMVGDCVKPRRINEAHSEGWFAAMCVGI